MVWKNLKQKSLADDLMVNHIGIKELDEISEFINWNRIESLMSQIHNKKRGEKAWPPLMMFKALLLQSWYGLSDPALEKQLARDLLFRRFVELNLSESVPDHSTFWRFRNLLSKKNLLESLIEEIKDQLEDQGLIMRSGEVSIIDASVIKAHQNSPNKDKQGNNTQDPEADYNVKNGSDGKRTTTYGYKTHANVDEDGFIKTYEYTSGNVQDSNKFISLLTGNEQEVYADSGYKSAGHDKELKRRHIENRVLERAYRNRPLTDSQKQKNKESAGTRSIVERASGMLKLHYGMGNARYMGLERNKARFGLMAMGYNIKRGMSVKKSLTAYEG